MTNAVRSAQTKTMIDPSNINYTAAFMLGLMGSPHCLGMCGAISALSAASSAGRSPILMLGFQFGRISSYALIGAIGGGIAAWLGAEFMVVGKALRLLASVLLIMVAVALAGWWRGGGLIERGGAKIWRRIQPLTVKLLPADRLPKALALGVLWGFLPCGLIYSSLAWASTSGSASQAAALMFFFGLGTLPAMLAVSAAQRSALAWLRNSFFRNTVAVFMILWAVFSASTLFASHGGHSGATDGAGQSMEHHHH